MKEGTKAQRPKNSMAVAWQLVVEEHLRNGGKIEDLKIDKIFTRKGRVAGKNKPYTR